MIKRDKFINKIQKSFKYSKMVCLLGPRQCGKTTIANQIREEFPNAHYFDLENIKHSKLMNKPELVLIELTGLIIIDEIQIKPELFSYLRYLHDQNLDQKFLILGSSSRDLIRKAAASLAGRITFIEITPFSLKEVHDFEKLWLRGGFPNSYLSEQENYQNWVKDYIKTYIEQDLIVPEFKSRVGILKNCWWILSHYHGQISNYAVMSSVFNVDQVTVKEYISYLESSFLIRILKPWHSNLKKQLIKNPKLYYRDSGLLNYILKIQNYSDIFQNEKSGAIFEGFAIEEIIRAHVVDEENCYFFTSENAELDLLIFDGNKKLGFEFKLSNSPNVTGSMMTAIKELNLDFLTVICPDTKRYMLAENIEVISLKEYIERIY